MKKIILMCLFSFMVSQTDVTSKLIGFDLSMGGGGDGESIPIYEVIGYDLERGTIQFVGFDGDIEDFFEISYYGTSDSGELIDGPDFYMSHNFNGATEDAAISYYFDSNISHMHFDYHGSAALQFNGTLYFIVTAEFPIEDTGYIEEGFDFCLVEGNNLVAFPCDNPVSVGTAIPELAQAEITQIIGAGVAATNFNGQFVGSLSNFTPGAGYWVKSSSNMCFNYTCAE